jgi:hypothetical protein
MAWEMHDREYETVLALPGERRYDYFLKRIADWQEVWSLRDEEGWALVAGDDGQELVPVWPHPRFAAGCATGAWEGYRPAVISLDHWQSRWLPGMARDGRAVAVFPTPEGKGVRVTPERLREDLDEELALYGEGEE